MSTTGRGVFESPYSHQIDALEAFWHEKDVLVSTGTGSGKTECFMAFDKKDDEEVEEIIEIVEDEPEVAYATAGEAEVKTVKKVVKKKA